MQAYQLTEYSGPGGLVLVDAEVPRPSENEVLLDVKAIGVNFPDLLMTKGQYQLRPELPVIPGCEVAGTVIEAPSGSPWQPGDRAAAFVWQGGFAERVAVPLNSIVPVPDTFDFDAAAATVVNYQTVYFALSRRGGLQPGETVLVMGAGGGIGTAAVQVAAGLHARVIGGVADVEQADTATTAGASETVTLHEGFAARVRDMTDGRGVDVVLDPLGDWLFAEAIRTLAPEGRLLVVGFAAGKVPEVKVNRLLLRNVSAVGVAFGAFLELDDTLMARQAMALNRMSADGYIKPCIGARYGFRQLPQALHLLDKGEIRGKAVIVIG